MVRPAEVEKLGGFDDIDLQRAARILLDLYASMHKPLTRDNEPPLSVAARARQA